MFYPSLPSLFRPSLIRGLALTAEVLGSNPTARKISVGSMDVITAHSASAYCDISHSTSVFPIPTIGGSWFQWSVNILEYKCFVCSAGVSARGGLWSTIDGIEVVFSLGVRIIDRSIGLRCDWLNWVTWHLPPDLPLCAGSDVTLFPPPPQSRGNCQRTCTTQWLPENFGYPKPGWYLSVLSPIYKQSYRDKLWLTWWLHTYLTWITRLR